MPSDLNVVRPSPFYPPVTPNDATDLATRNNRFPTGLSIGVAGTLRVTDLDGNVRNFVSTELSVGVIHPIRVKRVHSTGTTATNIRVYYDA